MNWLKLLKVAQGTPYGYWVTPEGKSIPVPEFKHAEVAYQILGGHRPVSLTDYTAPFAHGWCRLVTLMDAVAQMPAGKYATRSQAQRAAELLEATGRPKALIQFGGDDSTTFGFVEFEDVENVLMGRRAIKKQGPIDMPPPTQPPQTPQLQTASIKKLAVSDHAWVLPDGREIPVALSHVQTGWEYIVNNKIPVDPELEPSTMEDYRAFAELGWVRILWGNVQLWKPATPQQAKVAAQHMQMTGHPMIDIEFNGNFTTYKNNPKLVQNVLMGKAAPQPVMANRHVTASSGDYWVLPDGQILPVSMYHTDAGWDYLRKTEPNLDLRTAPKDIEDYAVFAQRGWIRICAYDGSASAWQMKPTPQQAKAVSQLLEETDRPEVLISINGKYAYIDNNPKKVQNALMGLIPLEQEDAYQDNMVNAKSWYTRLKMAGVDLNELSESAMDTVYRAVLDIQNHIWVSNAVDHKQIMNKAGLPEKAIQATGSIFRYNDGRLAFTGNPQIVGLYFGGNRNYDIPHNVIIPVTQDNFTLLEPLKRDVSPLEYIRA